jgi:hypothetical protein
MGLLNRSGEKQTLRERGELRRHLDDLGDLREEKLKELGGIAVGMHRGGGFDRDALFSAAAAIAAIDDEAKLVRRGLDEGLTLAQLEDLSRGSTDAAPADTSLEAVGEGAAAEDDTFGDAPVEGDAEEDDAPGEGEAEDEEADGPEAAAAGG